jgi:hypothetical protein
MLPFCERRLRHRRSGCVAILLLSSILSGTAAFTGQTASGQTSVCEVASQPAQFIGKNVAIRARIWPDSYHDGLFLLEQTSIDFDSRCPFLRARFSFPTDLVGTDAFGTFVGTLTFDSVNIGANARTLPLFVIHQQSDVRLRDMRLQGPVEILRFYDARTGSLVSPGF